MAVSLPPLTLILGGQRSGKSALAEKMIEDTVAAGTCGGAIYLATAEPVASAGDPEMAARIDVHRARRGAHWRTVEEPLDVLPVIVENARPDCPVLVDCLTLWLSNVIAAGRDPDAAVEDLAAGLTGAPGPVVLVSNEVGLGVIPANAMARAFADAAGRANQRLARAAIRVLFTAAGLPLILKDTST